MLNNPGKNPNLPKLFRYCDLENINITTNARELGFEVILDIAPNIFDILQISYDDLTFFSELNASGIRLD
ncbi:MupG family TIM beta-alpha barrel fold protein, partial [Clostridioides difficile]|uniref:MupG family TIM beta-alpha barrel fold protein n=1 Tax=Clostridioides difficile TaxID=1496 RepID=UPI001F1EC862